MEVRIIGDKVEVSDPECYATIDYETATVTIGRYDGEEFQGTISIIAESQPLHAIKMQVVEIWAGIKSAYAKAFSPPTDLRNARNRGLNKLRKRYEKTR